jgi:amino acid adenylation domain-containing protein
MSSPGGASAGTPGNHGRAELSLGVRFAETAARHARRVAVSTATAEWTYEELDQRANAFALRLRELAGGAPRVVALLFEPGAPLIAAILGVLKAGGLYLALAPDAPPERLRAMLADSGARLLVCAPAHRALAEASAPEAMQVFPLEPERLAPVGDTGLPAVPTRAGAWLMYTSGSTGTPKGVWQNHRGAARGAEVYANLVQLGVDDRLSLLTSSSLSSSTTPLFAALLHGAALCCFDLRAQGVGRLAAWLREQRVSICHCVPTVFRHLGRAAGEAERFASVRLVRLGGEPVLRGDVEMFRRRFPPAARLMHSFSSTETGLISALLIDRDTPLAAWRVPVGRAVPGVTVELVDDVGRPVPPGGAGRIRVTSEHLRQGYWRGAETPDEDLAGERRAAAFLTSDLGRFLPDGTLEHLGRVDEVVKIRGLRVDLAEVEAALHATDLFADAAVTAPEDATGERRLIAYVVARRGRAPSVAACRRALQRRALPEHLLPSDFVALERLPQTAGGKVDRRALPEWRPRPADAPRRAAPPRKGIESELAALWQTALGVPGIGRDDDFFELGGTSIQAVQVLARVEEKFGLVLPAAALLEHSTVGKLAALVAGRVIHSPAGRLVVLRAAEAGRPLFFVHSARGDVATYGQLARLLRTRPVYGLQCPGLNGEAAPLTSVAALARAHVREIVARDPTGPYFIGGARFGAKVALETARQLAAQGRVVRFVVLFSFAPPAHGRFYSLLVEPVRSARDRLRILAWNLRRAWGRNQPARWLVAYRAFVHKLNCRLRNAHQPRFYPGAVTLFLTPDENLHGREPSELMSCYARATDFVMVAAERDKLFQRPVVEELARELDRRLAAAELGLSP